MKILFLIPSMASGGAERQLAILASGLQRVGHDVLVAEFYGGGLLEGDLHEGHVRLVDLEKGGRWHMVRFFLRMARLVRRERPDIIHGYLGIPNILSAFLRMLCPASKVVWAIRASNMDLSRYGWVSRFCYRLECIMSPCADLIIANSHAGKAHAMRNGFTEARIVVIHNGINTEHFIPDRATGCVQRKEWGVPDDVPLIGLVGRIDPMKDHETFLRAARRVYKERPDVRFVCVGRAYGARLNEFQRLARDLGISDRVIWAGEKSDLVAVYNSLDVLCLSSFFGEGFPNVVCEAMACGVPCVATDVGDVAAIVGSSGHIVPPRNAIALGDALLRIVSERRQLPDGKLRQHVLDCFSMDRLITGTQHALYSLLEKRPSC